MNLCNIGKMVSPPILLELWNTIKKTPMDLIGDYGSWDEALKASTGYYDSGVLFEKTKVALLKVKNGDAKYERDSIIFNEIQYSWPVLAGMMWVAAQYDGQLNVLDFGGSLGSTYYQNRVFLRNLPVVRWNIIEQPTNVEVGKKYFQDEIIKFFLNIEMCLSETTPNVIILSGVLQYLETPHEILNNLLNLSCDYVIIDRTPFWDGGRDRLCVQNVPSSIHQDSFPCWIFSSKQLHSNLSEIGFEVVADFNGFDKLTGPVTLSHKGMIIKRKKSHELKK